MNWADVFLWGFAATATQTGLEAGAQRLGLSRMSIPFMLGTIFTADRDRASLVGSGVHLVNGWLLALVYSAMFESLGRAGWWVGALLGLAHGLFVLLVVVPLLPSFHPRMASEHDGPAPTRALEPPGLLALDYGRWTVLTTLVGHASFGVIFGAFYHVAAG